MAYKITWVLKIHKEAHLNAKTTVKTRTPGVFFRFGMKYKWRMFAIPFPQRQGEEAHHHHHHNRANHNCKRDSKLFFSMSPFDRPRACRIRRRRWLAATDFDWGPSAGKWWRRQQRPARRPNRQEIRPNPTARIMAAVCHW